MAQSAPSAHTAPSSTWIIADHPGSVATSQVPLAARHHVSTPPPEYQGSEAAGFGVPVMPCAMPLLTEGMKMHPEGAKLLQSIGHPRDDPMAVIANVGDQRLGKSWFSNYIVGQLGGDSPSPMFRALSSMDPQTKNVDVSAAARMLLHLSRRWQQPEPLANISIAFFDTEGTGDRGHAHDAQINVLAMLTSSVVFFHCARTLRWDEVRRIFSLCTLATSIVADYQAGQPLFGDLHILVRDVQLKLLGTGEEAKVFQRFFGSEPHGDNALSKKEVDFIRSMFTNIQLHLLPHPCPNESGSTILAHEVSEPFHLAVQKVMQPVLRALSSSVRYVRGSQDTVKITGYTLAEVISSYAEQLFHDSKVLKLVKGFQDLQSSFAALSASDAKVTFTEKLQVALDKGDVKLNVKAWEQVYLIVKDTVLQEWKQKLLPNSEENPSVLDIGATLEGTLKQHFESLSNKMLQELKQQIAKSFSKGAAAIKQQVQDELCEAPPASVKAHLQEKLGSFYEETMKQCSEFHGFPADALDDVSHAFLDCVERLVLGQSLEQQDKVIQKLEQQRVQNEQKVQLLEANVESQQREAERLRLQHDMEVQGLKSDLDQQQQEVQSLRGSVSAYETTVSGLRSNIDDQEQKIRRQQQEVQRLEGTLTEQSAKQEQLEKQRQEEMDRHAQEVRMWVAKHKRFVKFQADLEKLDPLVWNVSMSEINANFATGNFVSSHEQVIAGFKAHLKLYPRGKLDAEGKIDDTTFSGEKIPNACLVPAIHYHLQPIEGLKITSWHGTVTLSTNLGGHMHKVIDRSYTSKVMSGSSWNSWAGSVFCTFVPSSQLEQGATLTLTITKVYYDHQEL